MYIYKCYSFFFKQKFFFLADNDWCIFIIFTPFICLKQQNKRFKQVKTDKILVITIYPLCNTPK